MNTRSAFIFTEVTAVWLYSADFSNQSALSATLPCQNNLALTRIEGDMELTVMDYLTEAGFKALKADFHTIMKQMDQWLQVSAEAIIHSEQNYLSQGGKKNL